MDVLREAGPRGLGFPDQEFLITGLLEPGGHAVGKSRSGRRGYSGCGPDLPPLPPVQPVRSSSPTVSVRMFILTSWPGGRTVVSLAMAVTQSESLSSNRSLNLNSRVMLSFLFEVGK